MTACRASRFRLAGAVLILAACAGEVAAQQGPIRLSPPRLGAERPAEAPPPEPVTAPTAAEEPARGEAKPEIIVSDTPALNVDGVGLVDERSGGLPDTLWKGSTRPVIDRLIAVLPVPSTSPAARGLAERVLVSTGAAPAQVAGRPAGSFVAVRAERLLAMGRSAPAAGLARAVPQREDSEPLSRVLLDAALIEYDNAGACQIVRRRIGRSDTPYWQRALIFCQALAGEHDRAQLGLSLLREQRVDDDAAFIRLVNALGGDQRPIADLPGKLGPLHLAMLRAARQQIPASAIERAEPAALRMIAQSPNTTIDTRLAAADRAEAAGALPTDALIQIFESVPIAVDDAGAALAQAEKAPQPRAHAAIYRLAKAQSDGAARAEALARGWALARTPRLLSCRGAHHAAPAARAVAGPGTGLVRRRCRPGPAAERPRRRSAQMVRTRPRRSRRRGAHRSERGSAAAAAAPGWRRNRRTRQRQLGRMARRAGEDRRGVDAGAHRRADRTPRRPRRCHRRVAVGAAPVRQPGAAKRDDASSGAVAWP